MSANLRPPVPTSNPSSAPGNHSTMLSRSSTRIGVIAVVLGIGSAASLVALPYSRCAMRPIGVADEQRAPGADAFELGPLEFDLRAYREAPELEPFRDFQRSACPGLEGSPIALTTCLMDAMAQAFPHGEPSVEFMSSGYVPTEALARHMAGEQGHCVTRSGLIATALLANGTPARVVQWFAVGHTMFEVWVGDEWVLFDPTSGVMLTGTPHIAALDSDLEIPLAGRWARPVAHAPDHGTPATACFAAPVTGARVYLEPWLYTRVGPHVAPFPYPQVAAVAEPTVTIGYGQLLAAVGLMLSALLGLGATALRLRGDGREVQSREHVAEQAA